MRPRNVSGADGTFAMMAPLPTPSPPGDRPELPRVRVEVRTAAGRTVGYEFGGDEFLIGGAGACDLRLPTSGVPPVGVQLTRKPDGVRVRRVAAGLPVLLNGAALPAGTVTALHDGDTLQLAGLTLVVQIQAPPVAVAAPIYVSPRLIPLDDEDVPTAEPVPDEAPVPVAAAAFSEDSRHLAERSRTLLAEEADRRAAWESQDAELIRRRRALDQQVEELETDRVLWHDRRRAIEQELADRRAEEAAAQEAELARARTEIAGYRQQWLDECNSHRAELVRQADELHSEHVTFEAERGAFEPRRQALRDELARTAVQTQDLARQRELFAADRDIFEKARATFEAGRRRGNRPPDRVGRGPRRARGRGVAPRGGRVRREGRSRTGAIALSR